MQHGQVGLWGWFPGQWDCVSWHLCVAEGSVCHTLLYKPNICFRGFQDSAMKTNQVSVQGPAKGKAVKWAQTAEITCITSLRRKPWASFTWNLRFKVKLGHWKGGRKAEKEGGRQKRRNGSLVFHCEVLQWFFLLPPHLNIKLHFFLWANTSKIPSSVGTKIHCQGRTALL